MSLKVRMAVAAALMILVTFVAGVGVGLALSDPGSGGTVRSVPPPPAECGEQDPSADQMV